MNKEEKLKKDGKVPIGVKGMAFVLIGLGMDLRIYQQLL